MKRLSRTAVIGKSKFPDSSGIQFDFLFLMLSLANPIINLTNCARVNNQEQMYNWASSLDETTTPIILVETSN